MSESNIKLNSDTLKVIEQRVLNCKQYGQQCNYTIDKIISDAEKKISRDFNVNPSTYKNDLLNFIPNNADFGYFGAD